jgi:hypothetical protein
VLLVNFVDVLRVDSLSLSGFHSILQVPEVVGAGLQLPAHLPVKLRQLNMPATDNNLYL